jgi:hypothetical protein
MWPMSVDTAVISTRDSVVHLGKEFLLPGSCEVSLGLRTLMPGIHYRLDERHGLLFPDAVKIRSAFSVADSSFTLVVHYQSLPLTFRETYRHRLPVRMIDTATGRAIAVGKPAEPFSLDDLFGANLQKSGSLVRGFTVGSNRDLSLTSGLRMQMSGNLTKDLSVVAALTDENSPLQPEGTTRTIQEVDKVFVELRSSSVTATLGDFPVEFGGNEFATLQRKLQGAKGSLSIAPGGFTSRVTVVGATPRGKYFSQQFQGADGVQGPYRLSGENNERSIIIIAATERVYINGERMIRGESNDYTIDYATAEVTFTPRKLITNASRITIDFEYTDRQYDRSFFGAQTDESLFNNHLAVQASFLREADDQNSPIDIALADSDKSLLRTAGADIMKASRSGVVLTGAGQGQYVAVDTLLHSPGGGDSLFRFYRYNPVDSTHAVYTITFQYAGPGLGDYQKITSVQYRFAGLRQGEYLPIRLLPLPTSHAIADVKISGVVGDDLTVNGEIAHSAFNANTFAAGDSRQEGNAYSAAVAYVNRHLQAGGLSLGQIEVRARERKTESGYLSMDRINAVEYARLWNITDSSQSAEEVREGSLLVSPVPALRASASYGTLDHGESFHSARTAAGVAVTPDGAAIAEYTVDDVSSRDVLHGLSNDWVRQVMHFAPRFGHMTALLEGKNEILLSHNSASDTLLGASYRLNEIIPGLRFDSVGGMRFQVGYGLRFEDSLGAGALRRAVTVRSQSAVWQLPYWSGFSSGVDLNLQQKSSAMHGTAENSSIALRWQGQYRPAGKLVETDAFYEVMTERSAKLERVFQRVPVGSGNYIYAGDQNNNHLVDEGDFQPARFDGNFIAVTLPTDQLVPVIGVRASSRFRLNGSSAVSGRSAVGEILGSLSSETYYRVEEKSSDPVHSDIYLLRLRHFLNDETTLDGASLFTEDFYIGEHDPKVTVRLRFNERRGLTQYALAGERLYSREQSARVRWQLLEEIANQTEFTNQRSILHASPGNPRARDMRLASLSMDWTYRPGQRVECGMKFSTGRGTNYDTAEISLNDQSLRLIYSFNERGQGTAEISREEVRLTQGGGQLPFELTGGRVTGRSWLWHIGFDYRMTRFLQSSLNYDGRSEGGGGPIHTAKAEVRAFF